MLVCAKCGMKVEADDIYCMQCTADLELPGSRREVEADELPIIGPTRLEWTDSIEEAVCFHWLAQCQRRLRFRIDTTEEIPYAAFEYGWKVVNRLYNELKVPKQIDPKTGKKRKATAKESFVYLLDHFDVTDQIVDENHHRIEQLCDCVLEIPDPGRMQEKRGYVTFDEPTGENPEDESADDKNPEESKATAIAVCTALRDALKANDRANIAKALADMLLSVRNARVHATISKRGQRRLGSNSDSTTRPRGKISSDYEIDETAQIQLSIGKILLAAKTRLPPEDVEDIVTSRMQQIMKEIRERVMKWPLRK